MAWAAICARTVFAPCPSSTLLVNTLRLPSSFSLRAAADVEGVIVALITSAKPLPRHRRTFLLLFAILLTPACIFRCPFHSGRSLIQELVVVHLLKFFAGSKQSSSRSRFFRRNRPDPGQAVRRSYPSGSHRPKRPEAHRSRAALQPARHSSIPRRSRSAHEESCTAPTSQTAVTRDDGSDIAIRAGVKLALIDAPPAPRHS